MKIVKEGKMKNDTPYVIQYPQSNDVESAHRYINALSKEKTFIRFQGEEITLEQEEKFINEKIAEISKGTGMTLFFIVDNQVHGICGIQLKDKTENHVGVLGLSIDASVRGQGVGKLFMQTTLDKAMKHIKGLRIITLTVMATNTVAISLYEKLGFLECGRVPLGVQHRGKFVDEIMMYREVNL